MQVDILLLSSRIKLYRNVNAALKTRLSLKKGALISWTQHITAIFKPGLNRSIMNFLRKR